MIFLNELSFKQKDKKENTKQNPQNPLKPPQKPTKQIKLKQKNSQKNPKNPKNPKTKPQTTTAKKTPPKIPAMLTSIHRYEKPSCYLQYIAALIQLLEKLVLSHLLHSIYLNG